MRTRLYQEQSAMVRFGSIAVACIISSAAQAKLDLPSIEKSATAYEQHINELKADSNAEETLRKIKRSEASENLQATVKAYEELVRLNQRDVRAWLKLG